MEDRSGYQVTLQPDAAPVPERMVALAGAYADTMTFVRGPRCAVRFEKDKTGAEPLGFLERFLVDL